MYFSSSPPPMKMHGYSPPGRGGCRRQLGWVVAVVRPTPALRATPPKEGIFIEVAHEVYSLTTADENVGGPSSTRPERRIGTNRPQRIRPSQNRIFIKAEWWRRTFRVSVLSLPFLSAIGLSQAFPADRAEVPILVLASERGFGLAAAQGSVSDGDVKFEASHEIGKGLISDPMQLHGEADLYDLKSAAVIASLWSPSKNLTGKPAVTIKQPQSSG
jgi:hypothetical protein